MSLFNSNTQAQRIGDAPIKFLLDMVLNPPKPGQAGPSNMPLTSGAKGQPSGAPNTPNYRMISQIGQAFPSMAPELSQMPFAASGFPMMQPGGGGMGGFQPLTRTMSFDPAGYRYLRNF